MRASDSTREFFDLYTRDFSSSDFQRLFTHDTRDAYRFFARHIDEAAFQELPPLTRFVVKVRLVFLAFALKLSPARRVLFGIALVMAATGLFQLFEGFGVSRIAILPFLGIGLPGPLWSDGTLWLLSGFILVNLLVLLEVADRLNLKNDLEIAREIQLAMLPAGIYRDAGVEAAGATRPANTVGGDFFDLLKLPDGRLLAVLGDVAGKGSPAALLMALLLAMLRTLATENLPPARLVERLNQLVHEQPPGSRFITMFLAVLDPATGSLAYINAGQTPPLLMKRRGPTERLLTGGMALGMFESASYEVEETKFEPGDLLVMYSDGITEAENPAGVPLDEEGLKQHLVRLQLVPIDQIGPKIIDAVARHAQSKTFADDLTVLALRNTSS